MITAAASILIAMGILLLRDTCRSLERRLEIRPARDAAPMAGQAIDTSALQPHLDAVRRDPVAAIQAREVQREYHEECFAAARRAVRSLAFFRDRTPHLDAS